MHSLAAGHMAGKSYSKHPAIQISISGPDRVVRTNTASLAASCTRRIACVTVRPTSGCKGEGERGKEGRRGGGEEVGRRGRGEEVGRRDIRWQCRPPTAGFGGVFTCYEMSNHAYIAHPKCNTVGDGRGGRGRKGGEGGGRSPMRNQARDTLYHHKWECGKIHINRECTDCHIMHHNYIALHPCRSGRASLSCYLCMSEGSILK